MTQRLVVRYPHQDDADFAHAYHEAATRLAASFTGSPEDDLILLPFLNLYRHAFELELKHQIRFLVNIRMLYQDGATSGLVDAVSEDTFRKRLGHNLHRLQDAAVAHYEALDMPEKYPQRVKEVTLLLHAADSTGTRFRYAGQLPELQEDADFPDLAALLDTQFLILGNVEDYVDALYANGTSLSDHM